jgi:hypothetical protein
MRVCGINDIGFGVRSINVSDRYVEGVVWFPMGEKNMIMTLGSLWGCIKYIWHIGEERRELRVVWILV